MGGRESRLRKALSSVYSIFSTIQHWREVIPYVRLINNKTSSLLQLGQKEGNDLVIMQAPLSLKEALRMNEE